MTTFWIVVCVLLSYMIGSINSSIIIGKLFSGTDIRTKGSGNAGATNTLRVLGGKAAIGVLCGDILKGVIAVLLSRLIGGEMGAWFGGIFCVVGHIFPIWFQFRGGKGVLTAATVFAMLDIRYFLIVILVFLGVVIVTRMVSLSAITAAVAVIIGVFILPGEWYQRILVALLALLVIWKHRGNIDRIIHGTESKLSFGKKG